MAGIATDPATDRWSVKTALLFGVLLGPPVRFACDALGEGDFPDSGRAAVLCVAAGMMLGAALFAASALLRNRIAGAARR